MQPNIAKNNIPTILWLTLSILINKHNTPTSQDKMAPVRNLYLLTLDVLLVMNTLPKLPSEYQFFFPLYYNKRNWHQYTETKVKSQQ